jgi:hypothetical protein
MMNGLLLKIIQMILMIIILIVLMILLKNYIVKKDVIISKYQIKDYII